MLKPAIMYRDELSRLQYETWFNDKYKYWNSSESYQSIFIHENTEQSHQFVSVVNGKIIGYIGYSICRSDNTVYSVSILNFTDSIAFGKDLGQAITDIFEKFKFRKLCFFVIVGNPIEKTYDKLIKKYGGRIVGVMVKDVKLIDGEYYDKKLYEILAEDYFTFKKMHKEQREERRNGKTNNFQCHLKHVGLCKVVCEGVCLNRICEYCVNKYDKDKCKECTKLRYR